MCLTKNKNEKLEDYFTRLVSEGFSFEESYQGVTLEGYDITNTQANAIASAFTDFIWEKIQNE